MLRVCLLVAAIIENDAVSLKVFALDVRGTCNTIASPRLKPTRVSSLQSLYFLADAGSYVALCLLVR